MKWDRTDAVILGLGLVAVVGLVVVLVPWVFRTLPPPKSVQLHHVGTSDHDAVDVFHDDSRGVTCYVARGGVSCFLDDEMTVTHENATSLKKWVEERKKEGEIK